MPVASRVRRASRKAGVSRFRQAAARIRVSLSAAFSQPKAWDVTTPREDSSRTPPRAKRSAAAQEKLTGSANTASAPASSAIRARSRVENRPAVPRCRKAVLITQTI